MNLVLLKFKSFCIQKHLHLLCLLRKTFLSLNWANLVSYSFSKPFLLKPDRLRYYLQAIKFILFSAQVLTNAGRWYHYHNLRNRTVSSSKRIPSSPFCESLAQYPEANDYFFFFFLFLRLPFSLSHKTQHLKKVKIMASSPITSWQTEKEESVTDFIF